MPLGSRALGVPVHCELGFRAFGLGLAARVVRTRGSFGAFLLSTLHLCQDRPPRPAHALFPLPVPCPGCFQHIPSAKASRVRSRVASRRVAHVAVMACNFLFSGASFVPLGLLSHRPNKAQAAALSYVHRLCRACGAVEPCLVSSAGRRNLSLLSLLGEPDYGRALRGPLRTFLQRAAKGMRNKTGVRSQTVGILDPHKKHVLTSQIMELLSKSFYHTLKRIIMSSRHQKTCQIARRNS